jgi:hypothetical protein
MSPRKRPKEQSKIGEKPRAEGEPLRQEVVPTSPQVLKKIARGLKPEVRRKERGQQKTL